ncbi:MAG: hypothetical protein O7E51_17595, partial [Acidobacteria bacterium]|nr:hypothetical protein [Acidobacteriota bacterium]
LKRIANTERHLIGESEWIEVPDVDVSVAAAFMFSPRFFFSKNNFQEIIFTNHSRFGDEESGRQHL